MSSWRDQLSDDLMFDRRLHREDPCRWSTRARGCVVCAAHYRATQAGAQILEAGGNAIDAAVATALALAVVEPAGCGLGGMAMVTMYLKKPGRTLTVEGPCRAPRLATPEKAGAGPRKFGYRAVAVPTHVAVIAHLLRRYGTMTAVEVLEPAIKLAEEGYHITHQEHELLTGYRRRLRKGNAGALFLDGEGNAPQAGSIRRQPVLAATLKQLAVAGFDDFYTGEIGREIARDMERNDGFITLEDLLDIPRPVEREPLRGQFRDFDVLTLGPPGGGASLLDCLALFERVEGNDFDMQQPRAALLFAMVIHQVRRERRRRRLDARPGSVGFETRVRERWDVLADRLRRRLKGEGETSHLCVIDGLGNVVSMTQSIERSFGSKVATPSLGFLYNGYMRGFKLVNEKHPHFLKPGAVARSNAAPTILLRANGDAIAIGSTGSERMVSGIFETLVRLVAATPFEAVSAPRLHCTPKREVLIEAARFPKGTVELLTGKGFSITELEPWSFRVGGLQLAGRVGAELYAVAEPRRDGAAAGTDS